MITVDAEVLQKRIAQALRGISDPGDDDCWESVAEELIAQSIIYPATVTASTELVPDAAHARITPMISQSDAERHLSALQDIDATIKLWEPKHRAGKIEAIVQRALADLRRESGGVDHDALGHKCLYCAPLGEVETMLRQRAEDAPEREAEAEIERESPTVHVQGLEPPTPKPLDDGTGQRSFTREEVLRLLVGAWSVSHEPTATVYIGAPGQMRERPGGPTLNPEHAAIAQLTEYEA